MNDNETIHVHHFNAFISSTSSFDNNFQRDSYSCSVLSVEAAASEYKAVDLDSVCDVQSVSDSGVGNEATVALVTMQEFHKF